MTNYKMFDLEAAKRGEPVVTRDGRKARIVCFDSREDHNFPMLVLVDTMDGSERCIHCSTGGSGENFYGYECELCMAAPAIPEGFTAYDPNVPPPEDAEEIELFDTESQSVVKNITWFRGEWPEMRSYSSYRVTKWKEAKPSLEDALRVVMTAWTDAFTMSNRESSKIERSLNKFADAIVNRAVDKIREDRG